MRNWGTRGRADGRLSALARRGVSAHYRIVNCWPSRRWCWPVIGRQWRLCARGERRGRPASPERGGVAAGDGGVVSCACIPIAASCARSRLLFAAERQTDRLAVSRVPIPRGSESPLVHSHVLLRLSGGFGSLWDWAFLAGDSDGVPKKSRRRSESLLGEG